MTIILPATIEAATSTLAGLDALVTAREWERAAIVAAFTHEGTAGRPRRNRSDITTITRLPREFAALGITGLRSDQTVRAYRNAWLTTGRKAVPGGTVDLDGLGTFPPTGNSHARANRASALPEGTNHEHH